MTNEERLHKLLVKRQHVYDEYTKIDHEICAVRRVIGRPPLRRYWTGEELLLGIGVSIAVGLLISWWLIGTMG